MNNQYVRLRVTVRKQDGPIGAEHELVLQEGQTYAIANYILADTIVEFYCEQIQPTPVLNLTGTETYDELIQMIKSRGDPDKVLPPKPKDTSESKLVKHGRKK